MNKIYWVIIAVMVISPLLMAALPGEGLQGKNPPSPQPENQGKVLYKVNRGEPSMEKVFFGWRYKYTEAKNAKNCLKTYYKVDGQIYYWCDESWKWYNNKAMVQWRYRYD